MWLLNVCYMAAMSGVFNLPYEIWAWWAIDSAVYTLAGTAVLGIVAEKLSPANA